MIDWDNFCNIHPNAWFYHTTYFRDYVLNSHNDYMGEDFSFKTENGICPLILEQDQFSFQGAPTPAFITSDVSKTIETIQTIAVKNNVKRILINNTVPGYIPIMNYAWFLNPGDIEPTKGHKSAIKKGNRFLTVEELTDTYKFANDYYEIAGRQTRPLRTFEILQQWIKLGFGILLAAKFDGKIAGYIYVITYKHKAYYMMSCVFPEFRYYNVTHFLQSKIFKLLEDKGIYIYDMGEQAQVSFIHQPIEKEKNISLFKRGFGGYISEVPCSEYFFDTDYMKKIYEQRMDSYIKFREPDVYQKLKGLCHDE